MTSHNRRCIIVRGAITLAVGIATAFVVWRLLFPAAMGGGHLVLPPRTAGDATRIAVIGDYGMDNAPAAAVAALVAGWQPDAIITTGDNNYPDGAATTIDAAIGQHYHAFIHPYQGSYGAGALTNRFFPVPGNHDWRTTAGAPPLPQPYLDYFTLPGNERYYDVIIGPVHLFALDSDAHEPDGIEATSPQADWLRAGLAASTLPWRIVALHHPPYSSSLRHGSTPALQWPYAAWGATALLAGHDHTYERIVRDGIVYFVNGIGGADIYPMGAPVPGSQMRFNADYGAMLIEATPTTITYTLAARTGVIYDHFVQHVSDLPPSAVLRSQIIERGIAASDHDAEESLTTHAVTLASTDLELTSDLDDPGETQIVGLHFADLAIAPGALIQRAYVEFTVDEPAAEATALDFFGEAHAPAAPFRAVASDLSSRVPTTARVRWADAPAWPVIGAQWRTPDLTPIVQEIIDRPDWRMGGALVLLVTGSGRRTAAAFDGAPAAAARLHIEAVLPHDLFLPAVLGAAPRDRRHFVGQTPAAGDASRPGPRGPGLHGSPGQGLQ